MRTYAVTYPQLMNQAIAQGVPEREMLRLRDGHDLAVGLVDGIYRRYGAPFICHLIRTGSIVMAENQPVDVVLAGMLHAVYFLHYFEGGGRRGPRRSDREFLRARIGAHAERLIGRYGPFPWSGPGVIRGYVAGGAGHSVETRELLLLKLANELEDCLDAATVYSVEPDAGATMEDLGRDCTALAEAMGHRELAADLRDAFATSRGATIPASLIRGEHGSHGVRRLWKANSVERVGAALRRRRARRRKGGAVHAQNEQ